MSNSRYDVVIVGAGVAGSSLAHALATLPRVIPLRIAVVERCLSEPDRIVGELLQPGGVAALQKLGMASCIENIDAITVQGYNVVEAGQSVRIPYPPGKEGRSFHHGRFVMALRDVARQNASVDFLEGTVSELLECELTGQVIGVRALHRGINGEEHYSLFGDLVVVADGCFSNLRSVVFGNNACAVTTKSHFVGTVLKDVVLPIPNHGTVLLAESQQPILLYQISERDTRILIDIQHPLPTNLKDHIIQNVLPSLPPYLHESVFKAFSGDRIRRMPNSFLPSIKQGGTYTKKGVILLGDAWNMRHPLTGGGMTVALNDVILLRKVLGSLPSLDDWDDINDALHWWHWGRKPLSSTINLLSGTLYGLFGEHDDAFVALRKGCFKYFQLGGSCISGPVSLLSGLAPSPALLISHFFSVVFYSIWILFSQSNSTTHSSKLSQSPEIGISHRQDYLAMIMKSYRMFCAALAVFTPILWSEIRWWAPSK